MIDWAVLAIVVVAVLVVAISVAPVLMVRLVTLAYPRKHARRTELVAEMAHVSRQHRLSIWRWLGGTAVVALNEGLTARIQGEQEPSWRIASRSNFIEMYTMLAASVMMTASNEAMFFGRWLGIALVAYLVPTTAWTTIRYRAAKRREAKRN